MACANKELNKAKIKLGLLIAGVCVSWPLGVLAGIGTLLALVRLYIVGIFMFGMSALFFILLALLCTQECRELMEHVNSLEEKAGPAKHGKYSVMPSDKLQDRDRISSGRSGATGHD